MSLQSVTISNPQITNSLKPDITASSHPTIKLDDLDLKILHYFHNENDIPVSSTTAYHLFKLENAKSQKTFYNRVNRLQIHGYLLHLHGGSPKYFCLNFCAKSLLRVGSKNYKLKGKLPRKLQTQGKTAQKITNSGEILGDKEFVGAGRELDPYQKYYSPFTQILHNFVIKVPIQINQDNYKRIQELDSTFKLYSENTNLRRYYKRMNVELTNGPGSFKASITIFRHSILIRLYEVYALDVQVGFSEGMDRVLEVLHAIEKTFSPQVISFSEMSKWKFPVRTGRQYNIENEFMNHPINKLFDERIKFTGKKSKFWPIDELGNKVGFDTSPRVKHGRKVKDAHLEFQGPDVVEYSDRIMEENIKYTALTGVGVKTLHETLKGVRNYTQRDHVDVEDMKNLMQDLVPTIALIQTVQHEHQQLISKHTMALREAYTTLGDILEKVHVKQERESIFSRIKRNLTKIVGM